MFETQNYVSDINSNLVILNSNSMYNDVIGRTLINVYDNSMGDNELYTKVLLSSYK